MAEEKKKAPARKPRKKSPEDRGPGGRPKMFQDPDELLELFADFCDEIRALDFEGMPTKTAFAAWLKSQGQGCDRRTIRLTVQEYYPALKKEWDEMLADFLSEGAARGKYSTTMIIFCLKNWCDWRDKIDTDNTNRITIEDFLRGRGEGQSM